ncbi:3-hydroxyacyl-CoA dehydrogenase NAD-binding domain-containing protein [Telmatospirillum sp.]|uniref:3-hydroxyacyl-CoA dehydrogenase/enoyl-CoA hydratase family protein n=1 Tax=Telmatospirillum sp. TaxID=2079197 RepID=UPI002844E9A0|nr:3-hydroxyacyl-CoA dehydrogenase NAD-binding domain-containing protein [Telmatospirillum sp.]MDR3436137.1 3-hydroxyacyl-CoA dehydrogenase NAD-binding domain-containing protein [Telmatospirillum sp.]
MTDIRKVAVIGAGVMGAGIAAQVANAGVPVVLLDIVREGAANRSIIAETAVEKMLKADPAPFMSKTAARLITTGNTEDHLALLGDCDWIIEAVIERPDIKQALYQKIDTVRKAGSVVSSNTSTIPLATLTDGLSDAFARDFCITHFFNPPRYMRLLEVVQGPVTRPEAVAAVSRFSDIALGKSVVACKDRPGFIANRLGVFWIQCAVTEAIDQGLEVEEADAVIGKPMGIPKTGVFGLIDLVGLDLMPHVMDSMIGLLPESDPLHAVHREQPLVSRMIAEGYTGRKGKGGFYRLNRVGGAKVKEAMSLTSGEYRPQIKPDLEVLTATRGDLKGLLASSDRLGRYALRVLGRTLAYAAALVPEAALDIAAVDEAMRLGYNWKWGPFELIDQLGAAWLAQHLAAEGLPVPALLRLAGDRTFYRVEAGKRQYLGTDGDYHDIVRPDGVLLLADLKLSHQPVLKNGSASLWDIGDGVACFEFTSKMNALDPDTMALLGKSLKLVAKQFKALVVYNEGSNFSAGANLGLALFAANIAAWTEIEQLVAAGQETYRALKYAPFPVVGAPSGLALGGSCEVLLHCDAVQAHAETYVGLVECGVGLVPGWGGCKEMLTRWSAPGVLPNGPMPAVAKVFETISTATVAKSAAEAKELLFLRPSDGITMNRYRLLADAKAKALELARDYVPPQPVELTLPGESARVGLKMAAEGFHRRGIATKHDLVVAGALAAVLSGNGADVTKPVKEEEVLELERSQFMRLVRHPATLARIESVLETGKPLRN